MQRTWQLLVCWVLLVGVAVGANQIFGYTDGGVFSIAGDPEWTVTISAPGYYQFWARDGDNAGWIRAITVNPPVTGTVFVDVKYSVGQDELPGAQDIWRLDLSGATDGQIGLLRLAGNYGNTTEGGTLICDSAQTLDIGGSVLKGMRMSELGNLTVNGTLAADITCYLSAADIDIQGTDPHAGSISLPAFSGTLHVHGDCQNILVWGDLNGEIHCFGGASRIDVLNWGDIWGSIECVGHVGMLQVMGWVEENKTIYVGSADHLQLGAIKGSIVAGAAPDVDTLEIDSTGSFHIGGDVDFTANGHVSGNITVDGTLWGLSAGDVIGNIEAGNADWIGVGHWVRGSLLVHGDLGALHVAGNLGASVTVEGDLTGDIYVCGDLRYDYTCNDQGGQIRIYGSLTDTGSIWISGESAWDTEGVVVDYDGFHSDDRWDSAATISVYDGPQAGDYNGNSPDVRLFEVTCLKGDCNNDGGVNTLDVDPFVLAITSESGYASAFPLLAGSRVYHADMNCLDGVTSGDIDPFVLRLTNPPAYEAAFPGCEACSSPRGDMSGGASQEVAPELSPAEIAALLASEVPAGHLGLLIQVVQGAAAELSDPARGEFWAAVATELSGE